MAGAAQAGIDSLVVGGGIHRGELGIDLDGGTRAPKQDLSQLCCHHRCLSPTYALPFLR